MYRERILGKDFTSIDQYMKAWGDFQDAFLLQDGNLEKFSAQS